jgi:choline dehydrogenase
MRVERQRDPRPLTLAFLDACAELGIRVVDDYHAQPDGAALTMVTQRRGRRSPRPTRTSRRIGPTRRDGGGTARAGRLTVRTGRDRRSRHRRGRTCRRRRGARGRRHAHRARTREVILSRRRGDDARAADALGHRSRRRARAARHRRHRRPARRSARPAGPRRLGHGVGTDGGSLYGADRDPRVLARWVAGGADRRRRTSARRSPSCAPTSPSRPPTSSCSRSPRRCSTTAARASPQHGMTLAAIVLTPESRGRIVTLRSADPSAPPIVDPGTFTIPPSRPRPHGQRAADRPGAADRDAGARRRVTDRLSPTRPLHGASALRAHARATGQTLYHPVGTCRMGSDERRGRRPRAARARASPGCGSPTRRSCRASSVGTPTRRPSRSASAPVSSSRPA